MTLQFVVQIKTKIKDSATCSGILAGEHCYRYANHAHKYCSLLHIVYQFVYVFSMVPGKKDQGIEYLSR